MIELRKSSKKLKVITEKFSYIIQEAMAEYKTYCPFALCMIHHSKSSQHPSIFNLSTTGQQVLFNLLVQHLFARLVSWLRVPHYFPSLFQHLAFCLLHLLLMMIEGSICFGEGEVLQPRLRVARISSHQPTCTLIYRQAHLCFCEIVHHCFLSSSLTNIFEDKRAVNQRIKSLFIKHQLLNLNL